MCDSVVVVDGDDDDDDVVADDDVEDDHVEEEEEDDDDDDDVEDDKEENEFEDDKVEDDDVAKEEDDDVEDDNSEEEDEKDDNVAEDEVEGDDVAEEEVQVDDVEDDEVKGEEDDDVENDDVDEEENGDVGEDDVEEKDRCPTLCASLRKRNACGHVTRATLCKNLQVKCRRQRQGTHWGPHFARACEVKMPWPLKSNFAREFKSKMPQTKTGDHSLCEPAKSKCTWLAVSPISHENWQVKCRRPRLVTTLCASLRNRNALGLTGKMPQTIWSTLIKHRPLHHRKNPSAWTRCLGSKNQREMDQGKTNHCGPTKLGVDNVLALVLFLNFQTSKSSFKLGHQSIWSIPK